MKKLNLEDQLEVNLYNMPSEKKQKEFKHVDRGDIVLINFNPQSGKEITGNRYAVVLSPNLFNANTGFVSLCPITNTKRGFGYEVDIPEFKVMIQKKEQQVYLTGVILTHQLKNLDARSRRLKIVGKLPNDITKDCLNYVHTYLA